MNLVENAGRLLDLKERKAALSDEVKTVNGEIEALSAEMLADMDDQGLETFAAHGATFYIKTSLYANLPAENREAFTRRLRARKLGHIVRPVVNPQTLTSFVKEQAAECGGPDALPDWITSLVSVGTKSEVATRKRR